MATQQPIGTEDQNGSKSQHAGPVEDNPSKPPAESAANRLDPSAPGETGTTPGSNAK